MVKRAAETADGKQPDIKGNENNVVYILIITIDEYK